MQRDERELKRQRARLRTVLRLLLDDHAADLTRRGFAAHLEAVWRISGVQGCPAVADRWWRLVAGGDGSAPVPAEAIITAVEQCSGSDAATRCDWLWRTLGPGPLPTLTAAFSLDTGAPPATTEPLRFAVAAMCADSDLAAFAAWSARTLPLLTQVLSTRVVHWFASSEAVEAARESAEARERERSGPPSLEKLLSLGPDTLRQWLRSKAAADDATARGSDETPSVWSAAVLTGAAPAEAGPDAREAAEAAEEGEAAPVPCREWQWVLSLALDVNCRGWTRLFSSALHGRSLHMLAQRTALYRGGVLLVVREGSGAVSAGFGANGLLAPKEAEHGVYFGNEQCCLLRLEPALQVCRAKALGATGGGGGAGATTSGSRNFVFLNNKRGVKRGVGFGGTLASPRFWLDPSLETGSCTAACEAYADGLVASEPAFGVARVEVWGAGGEAAEREQMERQDARDEARRRTARSFLIRERNDTGATQLAESDSWLIGLLSVGRTQRDFG